MSNFAFEFRDPLFLLLALLALPAWWMARGRQATIAFSSLRALNPVPASWRSRLSWLPAALFSASVVAMAVALAGPRLSEQLTHLDREGVAIMMVVDRSSSMNARDLVPDDLRIDRLEVVKSVFRRFVLGDGAGKAGEGRPNDLVGLVTFAGYADSVCPLTLDHKNLTQLVDQLDIVSTAGEDGTAVGDGLALAVERLRRSEASSRVAILLTDGESNAGVIDPLKAAELARETGVKVYCIGAGTNGIAPVPGRDPRTGLVRLFPHEVRIDEEALREIADRTGGAYFRATNQESLAAIYAKIDELERTKVSELRYVQYHPWFAPFAAAGLICMALAATLDSTIFRTLPEG